MDKPDIVIDGKKVEWPTVVVFVRHAEAESQGAMGTPAELDPPLTPLGKRQAIRVARRLQTESFSHAYSSPAKRASDTAQAIMEFHKKTTLTKTKDLTEVSRDHFVPVPGPFAPAVQDLLNKERDAMERFANHLRHTHGPAEKILVVCHGNLIRTLMPFLGGRDAQKSVLIEISNTSVTILDVYQSGQAVVRLANCVKHLLSGEIT
jgi:broad specificity phosphatase PhoE